MQFQCRITKDQFNTASNPKNADSLRPKYGSFGKSGEVGATIAKHSARIAAQVVNCTRLAMTRLWYSRPNSTDTAYTSKPLSPPSSSAD